MNRIVAALAVLLLLTSCTTTMTVRKVDTPTMLDAGDPAKEPEGVRYSLPKPLLMVTPQSDGTAKFEWIYVPDTSAQYAIETQTFIAKLKTSIEIDESGFLKKVVWNGGATDAGSAAVEAAADIRKAQIERDAENEKAAQEKAAAEKKKVDDAQAKVDELNALVQTTNAEVESLRKSLEDPSLSAGVKDKIREKLVDAEVRLRVAITKRDAALADLATLREQAATKGAGSSEADNKGFPKAWGPLFFEIVENRTTQRVSLRPVVMQQQFNTWKPAPKPAKPKFAPKDSNVARRVTPGNQWEIRYVSSVPLAAIGSKGEGTILRKDNVPVQNLLLPPTLSSGGEIVISLSSAATTGSYTLTLQYKVTKDSAFESETLAFEVP